MNILRKIFVPLTIFLIISPFIFLHFRSPHLFITHDGPFHIERTFNLLSSLKEGNFPPSWTNLYNSGFGSPIFLYLFPIPYVISVLIAFTGLDLVSVVKVDFIFWDLVAATGMYLWLRRGLAFSKTASLVGAIFYLYSPANIAQVFVRGSLREFAGAAIFPLVLLEIKNLSEQVSLSKIGRAALLVAIFLLTDGITVVTFLPLILVYAAYLFFTSQRKFALTCSFAVSSLTALLIASCIYLPFIFEMKFLRGPTNYYLEHFVYWWQLFDYHWGFGFSLAGQNDSMSFQLGIINLVAAGLLIALFFKKRLSLSVIDKLFLFLLVCYLFLIVEGPFSHLFWRLIPPLQLIQLPWRLLIPIVFIFSVIAASLVNKLKLTQKWVIIILISVCLVSFRYLRTNQIFVFEPGYLLKNSGDATAYHEFIPIWRSNTSEFANFPNRVEVVSGEAVIENITEKNREYHFNLTSKNGTKVRLNALYYPGWKARINESETPITISTNKTRSLTDKRDLSGLMVITVPSGKHQISLFFTDTPVRRVGKWLSIIGVSSALTAVVVGWFIGTKKP